MSITTPRVSRGSCLHSSAPRAYHGVPASSLQYPACIAGCISITRPMGRGGPHSSTPRAYRGVPASTLQHPTRIAGFLPPLLKTPRVSRGSCFLSSIPRLYRGVLHSSTPRAYRGVHLHQPAHGVGWPPLFNALRVSQHSCLHFHNLRVSRGSCPFSSTPRPLDGPPPSSTPRPLDGAASIINIPSSGRGRLHHQHRVPWTGPPPSSTPRPLDGAASIINIPSSKQGSPHQHSATPLPGGVASHQYPAQPGGVLTGLGRNKCVWLCSKLLSPRGTDAVYKHLPRNSSADLLLR